LFFGYVFGYGLAKS